MVCISGDLVDAELPDWFSCASLRPVYGPKMDLDKNRMGANRWH